MNPSIRLTIKTNSPFTSDQLLSQIRKDLAPDYSLLPAQTGTMGGYDVLVDIGQHILTHEAFYAALFGLPDTIIKNLVDRHKKDDAEVVVRGEKSETQLTQDRVENEKLLRELLNESPYMIQFEIKQK